MISTEDLKKLLKPNKKIRIEIWQTFAGDISNVILTSMFLTDGIYTHKIIAPTLEEALEKLANNEGTVSI